MGITNESWIHTDSGPKQAKEILDKECYSYNNSELVRCLGSISSKKNQVYEIITNEGYKIKATEDQRFLSGCEEFEYWLELKELKKNTSLFLTRTHDINWGYQDKYENGYLLGYLIGDGTINKRDNLYLGYSSRIDIFKNDYNLLPLIQKCIGSRIQPRICGEVISIQCLEIDFIRDYYGMKDDKLINPKMESSSSEFLSGLLSGFYDTDGSVKSSSLMIKLGQSNLQRLETVQRILLYFGIVSTIGVNTKQGIRKFSNGNYNCQTVYALCCFGINSLIFNERIGFKHKDKSRILNLHCRERRVFNKTRNIVYVKEIKKLGLDETINLNSASVAVNGFICKFI